MEPRSTRRRAGLAVGLPPLLIAMALTVPTALWTLRGAKQPVEQLESDGQVFAQQAADKQPGPNDPSVRTRSVAEPEARPRTLLGIGGRPGDAQTKAASPSEIWNRGTCRAPTVPIEKSTGCDSGRGYPLCRWRVPSATDAGRIYDIWRNTVEENRWGRPALVRLLLGAASEYSKAYPGELLAIGDLDAPGPRHNTHDNGVDADLYLPRTMLVENLGGGEYADNYEALSPLERRMLEARVEFLARALATCSRGKVRIYYNDPNVRARFVDWYRRQGFRSEFGAPMQAHNELHDFHFHITIPEDLAGGPHSD